jgi:hypothetical protein
MHPRSRGKCLIQQQLDLSAVSAKVPGKNYTVPIYNKGTRVAENAELTGGCHPRPLPAEMSIKFFTEFITSSTVSLLFTARMVKPSWSGDQTVSETPASQSGTKHQVAQKLSNTT